MSLSSLVESCVKLSRRLIDVTIRNNALKHREFELVVSEAKHLVNKRPLCFKESLRDLDYSKDIPEPITPELLIYGRDLPSLNLIPSYDLECNPVEGGQHENYTEMKNSFHQMSKIRGRLRDQYHEEFLVNLLDQAVAQKNRYIRRSHHVLKHGDIVLIKDEYFKALKYPMGLIEEVEENDLGEITTCRVRKGNGEVVSRHVESLIPYLSGEDPDANEGAPQRNCADTEKSSLSRPRRAVAQRGMDATKQLFTQNLA